MKVDYTDIYDILTFVRRPYRALDRRAYLLMSDLHQQFRGDNEDGTNGEDDLARQIAEAGLTWSQTHWRKEDMVSSAFSLLKRRLGSNSSLPPPFIDCLCLPALP